MNLFSDGTLVAIGDALQELSVTFCSAKTIDKQFHIHCILRKTDKTFEDSISSVAIYPECESKFVPHACSGKANIPAIDCMKIQLHG